MSDKVTKPDPNNDHDKRIKRSIKSGKAGAKAKKQKSLGIKVGGVLAFGVFLYYFLSWGFATGTGGMGFGICKVFLEQQVQYPLELKLSSVSNYSNRIRIWYLQHDSFGQTRFDAMDCYFNQDSNGYLSLDKVTVNRREVDPELISKFNPTISAIYAYPPDLSYPKGLPDNLRELKSGD